MPEPEQTENQTETSGPGFITPPEGTYKLKKNRGKNGATA
jgi:hypothetical protein